VSFEDDEEHEHHEHPEYKKAQAKFPRIREDEDGWTHVDKQ